MTEEQIDQIFGEIKDIWEKAMKIIVDLNRIHIVIDKIHDNLSTQVSRRKIFQITVDIKSLVEMIGQETEMKLRGKKERLDAIYAQRNQNNASLNKK